MAVQACVYGHSHSHMHCKIHMHVCTHTDVSYLYLHYSLKVTGCREVTSGFVIAFLSYSGAIADRTPLRYFLVVGMFGELRGWEGTKLYVR